MKPRGPKVVFGLLFGLLVGACKDSMPQCRPGELRYDGRPPESMFAYDHSCRADCFSFPDGSCDADCGEVQVGDPAGALLADDRQLVLADASSLGGDKALIHTFTYEDEAGGTAPEGWTFLAAGPGTYVSNRVEGTARFRIDTTVAQVERQTVDGEPVLVVQQVVGESRVAWPGRLELFQVSEQRLAGRFYLSYERPTEKPEAEVMGCFDLALSAPLSGGVRVLKP